MGIFGKRGNQIATEDREAGDERERWEQRSLLFTDSWTVSDLDLDKFADGIVAHRSGKALHDNPYGWDDLDTLTHDDHVGSASWAAGWRQRKRRVEYALGGVTPLAIRRALKSLGR
jgi:hypothetical protein